jgi:hypothetical protein
MERVYDYVVLDMDTVLDMVIVLDMAI